MLDLLRVKIDNIKEQARLKKAPFIKVLFSKFSTLLFKALLFALDLLVFVLVSPITFVLIIVIWLVYKPSKLVYFVGLEHVINKTFDRAETLSRYGFGVKYFSYELTGQRNSKVLTDQLVEFNWLITFDFLKFLLLFLQEKPVCLEVYLEGNCWRQYLMCITARISGCKIAVIERGQLSNFFFNTITWVKKRLMLLIYKLADIVLYREPYMESIFNQYQISSQKLIFDYNRIGIKSEPNITRNDKVVLFLNGFAKFRRLDIVVKSIHIVRKQIPDVKYVFVGARNQLEKEMVCDLLKRSGVEDNTEVHFWTSEPEKYYSNASVFVLPADLVFCNFSLLEAMERGVPPVIANVQDADRIVDHGINGFLSSQDAPSFANYITELLSDEQLRVKMGKKAREKIIFNFHNEDRMKPLLALIGDG
jgi:glycosyltransferase involved in cell wall biosynthesis